MDFITTLFKDIRKSSILVVTGKLTKYVHFIPLNNKFNSISVAAIFVIKISKLQGILRVIILNSDPIFMSKF